jgi:hypothetical protein
MFWLFCTSETRWGPLCNPDSPPPSEIKSRVSETNAKMESVFFTFPPSWQPMKKGAGPVQDKIPWAALPLTTSY